MTEIQYDSCGRMKYHPDYHFNHKKPYTVKELAYICATYQRGARKSVAMAVGRTESTISDLICKMKKDGTFDHYRQLGQTM
ncbi:DNA-entry nuclease [Bacillus sp. FSL L8-0199]|uniref:DNA-entry nuclease n=1 Tax=Bacillus sp. FSL L8-0199 TaxID=2954616 RepID=UPI0030F8C6D0